MTLFKEGSAITYYSFLTYGPIFYSVQVALNGNKLVFENVRYPDEIGIYQCVAENPHGMIVSSTYVKVLGKYLENCVNSKIFTLILAC